MAISPYRASTDLFRPLFEDLFAAPAGDGGRLGSLMRAPLADVVESEADIRVTVELPGMSPDNIEIDIENNVLTISGEKQEQRQEGDEKHAWHLTERRYGHFSRSFVLPRDVDQEGINAAFENGILTVIVPKSERARRRRIEVKPDSERQNVQTTQ
jgi:HSP20 family protein